MGLALSEDKTKLTHWRYPVRFLGYQLHGKPTRKGTSIRPILSIPHEKLKGIKEDLEVVSGYHNIPEIDVLLQMSAMFRGWCNYYRYATAPQATFSDLSSYTWWSYAHYVARKHRLSIAQMIRQERQAGRLGVVKRNGRRQEHLPNAKSIDKTVILGPVATKDRPNQSTCYDGRMDSRPETSQTEEPAERDAVERHQRERLGKERMESVAMWEEVVNHVYDTGDQVPRKSHFEHESSRRVSNVIIG